MQIVPDDVRIIAKLASLHLDDDQVLEATKDLSHVMDLLNRLEAFEVDDSIEPLEHPFTIDSAHAVRSDVAETVAHTQQAQAIAPLIERDVYLVPQVID